MDKNKKMVPLIIDLQDGFSNDTVIIQINDEEVFRKKGVSTDYALGRADSVTIHLSPGSVNVKVIITTRNLSKNFTLELSKKTYLGISINKETIDHRISDEMFLYF